jgi:hypothetical protein
VCSTVEVAHTKVPVLCLTRPELRLKLIDPLPQLLGLSGSTALLGNLLLQGGEVLLHVNEVEDDVEHPGEDEGEEQRRAGEVDCEASAVDLTLVAYAWIRR